ncbi:hypothetical protein GGX14DRAFT_610640 [Mycena pura]|uniref:DUF6699 domain-containing protein n=1 Tax=Mycena pura TaxID=153505 RepID=A0AAD6VRF0_9AGAR|nr:hypothetical protein GGX14DRAFT_610640 [Mycena pura]
MAAPFLYVPEASSDALPVPVPYHNAYYSTPQTAHTPFLPPSPLVYPSSPYRGADGAGANLPTYSPNAVPWPQDVQPHESAPWAPLRPPRERTSSWAAPSPRSGSPFLQPTLPKFLRAGSPGHRKSQSTGAFAPPAWALGAPAQLLAAGAPMIHPWLNGDAPSAALFFDLAPALFAPRCLASRPGAPPWHRTLAQPELAAGAFWPPRTTLRILLPRLPFWPIDLAPARAQDPVQAPPPPITLGDVLAALHHALHVRAAAADWGALPPADRAAVSAAFTQRCRAEAMRSGVPAAQLREREAEERQKGMKRVDFLGGMTVFKGLVKAPPDPEGCVRMVTA